MSEYIPNEGPIPPEFAFAKEDPESHVTFSENRNPHLRWSDVPEGTRSFALICVDRDVPAEPTDVNVEGRSVASDRERTDFYHWALVDIPADVREIPEGAVSREVTPKGKPLDSGRFGRSGRNSYTEWFAGNTEMEGIYGGYDGPGPPWNDERVHRYYFRLYALDTDQLDVPEDFDASDVLRAIRGHVLAEAERMGTYTLNPHVRWA